MQVRILASGSKGNAVFVEMDGTKLLLDAGWKSRALAAKSDDEVKALFETN